jgi:hypothetical protein
MMPETQACLCGHTEFDRVKVDRPGGPYVTAFIACQRCGVMYHAPIKPGAWAARRWCRLRRGRGRIPSDDLDGEARSLEARGDRYGSFDISWCRLVFLGAPEKDRGSQAQA